MPRIFGWFRSKKTGGKTGGVKKDGNDTGNEEKNVDVDETEKDKTEGKDNSVTENDDSATKSEDVSEDDEFNDDVIENKEPEIENKEPEIENKEPEIENKEPEIENKEKDKDDDQNEDKNEVNIKDRSALMRMASTVDDTIENKAKPPYDPAKKADVLKEELVTNYLHNKSVEKEEREEQLGKKDGEEAGKPSRISKMAEHVGKAVKITGVANDVVNTCVGVLNSGMGYKGLVQASKNKSESTPDDTTPTDTTPTDTTPSDTPADDAAAQDDQKKSKTSADKLKMGTAGVSMLTSLTGGLSNIAGFGLSGLNTLTTKNNRKKWSGIFGMATNTAGLLANASKFTASGLSLFGNQDKKKTAAATGWMGVAGAGAGLLASSINTLGSAVDWNYRRLIVNRTKGLSKNLDYNGKVEKIQKKAVKQAKANRDWEEYKKEKTRMNELKAMKYAMKQASDMNTVKKGQMWKGMAGVVGGIGSLTSSLAAAIPAFGYSTFGQIMKASGGAISALTNIAKQYEKVSDKNADSKLKEKKTDVVNEYLEKKKDKLDAEVKEFYRDHRDFATVTQKEKKRILMARLGVDLEITDDELSSADYDKAFDLINHKRALNIMNSSDEVRAKIFEALRLKENAKIEDVESVLRGD